MNIKRKDFLSYAEAKLAISDFCLEINNVLDYRHSYKEAHAKLPSRPEKTYKDDWLGWADFLGK
jgi:hypothetical protein